jgi:hypothetical protein
LEFVSVAGTASLEPPPAAIAPGPAGLTSFFFLGAGLAFAGAASSSASSRAFSALRASSARRLASFSSLALFPLAPSSHFSASFFACQYRLMDLAHKISAVLMESDGRTLSAAVASCFFASFSAFLARPLSFFAFPPLGAIPEVADINLV